MKSSVEWRRQNKEWGVYSRLVKTSDFISNPNANWLGVVTPSGAMKTRWSMRLMLLKVHFPSSLSTPEFTCGLRGQFCYMLTAFHFNHLQHSASQKIFSGSRSPRSGQPERLTISRPPQGNFVSMRNGSQWKSTQALCLGYIILKYVTNHPQWYANGTETNCPY